MSLSKEQKEALNDHFKGKDLYDPSKAPEQEVTTFAPKGMNCGGMAEGYAEGGEIDLGDPEGFESNGFDGPVLSAATDTARGAIAPPPPTMALPRVPAAPAAALPRAAAPVSAPVAPQAAPAAAVAAQPGKLAPDEYSQLVKALSTKPSVGQGVMSGLAGLADAIETGVARAGSPGFQKNIAQTQQDQKQNLITALRGKYEAGLGTRGASESERHNKASERIGEKEMDARLSESKAALQQNALEAMGRLSASGGLEGRILGHSNETKQAIDALAERAGLVGGHPAAKPLTATNKTTGQKVQSIDGGKTWHPIK